VGEAPRRSPGAAFRCFLIALAILPAFLTVAVLPCPADAASRTRPAKGIYHLVNKGETLSGIAQAYGVTSEAIREANNMSRKDHLEADQALFIPGAKKVIDDTRPRAARKNAKPPPSTAPSQEKTSGKERKSPGTAREKDSAGGKEPARPKRKEAEAAKAKPASGSTAATAKPRIPAAKKPKVEGTAGPAPAPATATSKASVPKEEASAPAGRITVTEGRVYFSEADREKAEQAAAAEKQRLAEAEKQRAADAAKASQAKAQEKADRARETAGRQKEEPERAKTHAPVPPVSSGKETAVAPARTDPAEEKAEKSKRKKLQWPVKGRVVMRFGPQPNGMYSNGVRIAAREGTAVVAAEQGTVIFSAPLKDYGETIILRHEDSYATVYTNLGSRMVNADDKVRAGTRIGAVGRDNRTGSGLLHFEVRVKNKACNPLLFLN
ncbi:MAG: hypothetical protein CVU61_04170, partial [Deltaproteobacteria bacterium HGW-Deltaproteobacteria-19]